MAITTSSKRRAAGPSSFTRQSSGLVRQVSTADTFFYGLMQLAVAYVVFMIAAWHLYPGASMELATALTLVGALAIGVTYALFSSVYPRSGGEYVFLSRTIHPGVGFAASFMVAFWQAFYFGINGALLSIYGLAPTFQMLGIQQDSQALTDIGTFFTKEAGIFITGTVIIVGFSLVQHRGLKRYFTMQRWFGLAALASAVACLVVLVLGATGTLDFESKFNALAGSGAYDGVISSAAADGVNTAPAFSLGRSIEFMIWPAFSLFFAVLSTSFSGEIKNVSRGQLFGISGAMVVGAALMIAFTALTRAAVGDEFVIASAAADFPLDTSPFVNVFASVMVDNVLVTVLVNLWVVLIMILVAGTTLIYSSRAMLAWGVDRVAPARLSSVGRHHTPGTAILVTAVVAESCLAIYAFTDLLAVLSGLAGIGIAFLLTCVAGVAFPFLKRDTFESSPAALRVFGVPLIAVTGLVGSGFLGYVVYRAFVDEGYGATSTTSILTNVVIAAVAALWYAGVGVWRRRQGEDLNRRFAEIPTE